MHDLQLGVDRRALMMMALATLTAGCVRCPRLAVPAAATLNRLGDAHVHLFNAADLPVTGFMRFVVIPEFIPHLPEIVLALVDSTVDTMKALAPSARAEQRSAPWAATAGEFADRLAGRIERLSRPTASRKDLAPADDLGRSYEYLAAVLREAGPKALARGTDQSARVDRAFLADVALRGRAAAGPVGARAALAGAGVPAELISAPRSSDDLGPLWDTIKWCYAMVLPRCRHVEEYLSTIALAGRPTDLIVNLLVDYDAWLGDAPSPGSAMMDQLRFWDGYSRRNAPAVTIKTFAGYDPLRHAEERLAGGGRSTYWDQLSAAVDIGAPGSHPLAAGFKIYPPMGFRVIGNAGMELATDRSGALVRARWNERGWPVETFGARIDEALDIFFEFCASRWVPVVAHGYDSQSASTGTGADASPQYWFERAQWVTKRGLPPLRALIAHWGPTSEFGRWMPRILELNAKGGADIYFDIAYSRELLRGDAVKYLSELAASYASSGEATVKWLMFGSDWIMLGREPEVGNYAANTLAAMAKVPILSASSGAILHDNLRRFLTRPS